MELCLFDAGNGLRLGVRRRNHIVDVGLLGPAFPSDRAAFENLGPAAKSRVYAHAAACPTRAALVRHDAVRIVEEWTVDLLGDAGLGGPRPA